MIHQTKFSVQKNYFKTTPFIKTFVFVFIFFIATSCSNKNYKENMTANKVDITESYDAIASPKKLETAAIKNKNLINLKIIRSASVKYKVNDVKLITKKIRNIVALQNGYISDLRFSNNLYQKENRFTIKVPHDSFDFIMDSIPQFANFIDFENITSRDVTEEYIDIQTRLKTKLEIKERYESILRKRAKTVEDILATEEKLRVLQEEIEASQGRLNYLTNKVSLSTIEVNLYESVEYKDEPTSYSQTFLSKVKNGFSFGWDLIANIFISIIYIWPLLLIAFTVFLFFKRKKK